MLGLSRAVLFLNYAHNDQVTHETLKELQALNLSAALIKADMGSPEATDGLMSRIHEKGSLDEISCHEARMHVCMDEMLSAAPMEVALLAPPGSLMLSFSISPVAVSRRRYRQCVATEVDMFARRQTRGAM